MTPSATCGALDRRALPERDAPAALAHAASSRRSRRSARPRPAPPGTPASVRVPPARIEPVPVPDPCERGVSRVEVEDTPTGRPRSRHHVSISSSDRKSSIVAQVKPMSAHRLAGGDGDGGTTPRSGGAPVAQAGPSMPLVGGRPHRRARGRRTIPKGVQAQFQQGLPPPASTRAPRRCAAERMGHEDTPVVPSSSATAVVLGEGAQSGPRARSVGRAPGRGERGRDRRRQRVPDESRRPAPGRASRPACPGAAATGQQTASRSAAATSAALSRGERRRAPRRGLERVRTPNTAVGQPAAAPPARASRAAPTRPAPRRAPSRACSGCDQRAPALRSTPAGRTTSAPTAIAIASPPPPGNTRPVRWPRWM